MAERRPDPVASKPVLSLVIAGASASVFDVGDMATAADTDDDDNEFDEGLRAAVAAELGPRLRRQWGVWGIRLVLGIAALVYVIMTWPHLWWLALVYVPFPIFSAVVLLRLQKQFG